MKSPANVLMAAAGGRSAAVSFPARAAMSDTAATFPIQDRANHASMPDRPDYESHPGMQPDLFGGSTPTAEPAASPTSSASRSTGLFGKALFADAVEVLPRLPDTADLNVLAAYLKSEGLHYSGQQTRNRFSSYILRRLFPSGVADRALRRFARLFPDSQALRDVALYRYLKAEPLIEDVLTNVLLPARTRGALSRKSISSYLRERFPTSKYNSVQSCAKETVQLLTAAGAIDSDRRSAVVRSRSIPLESFAFVIHSEYPDPGMHDVDKLEANRTIRALGWATSSLVPALYELRNRGLIARVSEIDRVRQFTTRYTLEQLVDALGEPQIQP